MACQTLHLHKQQEPCRSQANDVDNESLSGEMDISEIRRGPIFMTCTP